MELWTSWLDEITEYHRQAKCSLRLQYWPNGLQQWQVLDIHKFAVLASGTLEWFALLLSIYDQRLLSRCLCPTAARPSDQYLDNDDAIMIYNVQITSLNFGSRTWTEKFAGSSKNHSSIVFVNGQLFKTGSKVGEHLSIHCIANIWPVQFDVCHSVGNFGHFERLEFILLICSHGSLASDRSKNGQNSSSRWQFCRITN